MEGIDRVAGESEPRDIADIVLSQTSTSTRGPSRGLQAQRSQSYPILSATVPAAPSNQVRPPRPHGRGRARMPGGQGCSISTLFTLSPMPFTSFRHLTLYIDTLHRFIYPQQCTRSY